VRRVPSTDEDYERCAAQLGARATMCWARLDHWSSGELVAVIPLSAPDVVRLGAWKSSPIRWRRVSLRSAGLPQSLALVLRPAGYRPRHMQATRPQRGTACHSLMGYGATRSAGPHAGLFPRYAGDGASGDATVSEHYVAAWGIGVSGPHALSPNTPALQGSCPYYQIRIPRR
jgi:hypothetical protein